MLTIDGISKSYYGNPVLKPIRFCLPPGCCIGITGENGSGKSTLLRLLAQIEQPDTGDIRYCDTSILGDREFMRRHLGYVPQHHELLEDLTVHNQLKLWQSACGLSGPLPEEILDLLGIHPMMKKPIKHLSGGMKRRVSIAMALLSDPDILIMDEATTGLDKSYCERLLTWLEGFLSRGGSMIWCSHHPNELQRLCGACIQIRDGQIVNQK